MIASKLYSAIFVLGVSFVLLYMYSVCYVKWDFVCFVVVQLNVCFPLQTLPEVLDSHQVRVQVKACGLSPLDLKVTTAVQSSVICWLFWNMNWKKLMWKSCCSTNWKHELILLNQINSNKLQNLHTYKDTANRLCITHFLKCTHLYFL